jgi:hypothetical protein
LNPRRIPRSDLSRLNKRNQNSIIALAISLLLTVVSSQLFAQTEKQTDIIVNKKPLSDFGRELKQKIDNKEIDLNSQFVVEISGIIDRNGKLDSKTTKIIRAEGDQKVTDTVKNAIIAFSDTGFLQYLRTMDINEVNILVKQDDSNVAVAISSIAKTKEKAKILTSTIGSLLKFAPIAISKQSKVEDSTEIFILKSTTARADDDKLIVEFVAPKEKVHEIISHELVKYN